jgi:hypothetical protein
MVDVTTSITIKAKHYGRLVVTCPDTVDDGDYFTITLADHGITKIAGILGFIHTTADSILAQEQPTTSVTTGTLTVTVGGATDNKQRTYIIFEEPE